MEYFDNDEVYSPIKLRAKRKKNNEWITAIAATKKDGPFYCPYTGEELIIRKCTEKRDHFAYKGRLSPIYGSNESELHKECKNEICDELKKIFPKGDWQVERTIKENKDRKIGKLVPDISGRIPTKNIYGKETAVAIEVQASSLTIDKIRKRISGYCISPRNVHVLWIVPLKEELGDEKFRPRLFERYLHQLYYGRVYYWVKGYGTKLKPVHFNHTTRYIEERSWFETGGHEQTAGGYDKRYRVFFEPNYGKEVDIKDFVLKDRPQFTPENTRKNVPRSLLFWGGQPHWWDVENE